MAQHGEPLQVKVQEEIMKMMAKKTKHRHCALEETQWPFDYPWNPPQTELFAPAKGIKSTLHVMQTLSFDCRDAAVFWKGQRVALTMVTGSMALCALDVDAIANKGDMNDFLKAGHHTLLRDSDVWVLDKGDSIILPSSVVPLMCGLPLGSEGHVGIPKKAKGQELDKPKIVKQEDFVAFVADICYDRKDSDGPLAHQKYALKTAVAALEWTPSNILKNADVLAWRSCIEQTSVKGAGKDEEAEAAQASGGQVSA